MPRLDRTARRTLAFTAEVRQALRLMGADAGAQALIAEIDPLTSQLKGTLDELRTQRSDLKAATRQEEQVRSAVAECCRGLAVIVHATVLAPRIPLPREFQRKALPLERFAASVAKEAAVAQAGGAVELLRSALDKAGTARAALEKKRKALETREHDLKWTLWSRSRSALSYVLLNAPPGSPAARHAAKRRGGRPRKK